MFIQCKTSFCFQSLNVNCIFEMSVPKIDKMGYFQTPVVWWKEGFSQTRFLCTMQYFGSSSLLMAFLLLCFAALKVKVELERIAWAAFYSQKIQENQRRHRQKRQNWRGFPRIVEDCQELLNIAKDCQMF